MNNNNIDNTQIIEVDEKLKEIQITDKEKKESEVLSVEQIEKEIRNAKKSEKNNFVFILLFLILLALFIYFLPQIISL